MSTFKRMTLTSFLERLQEGRYKTELKARTGLGRSKATGRWAKKDIDKAEAAIAAHFSEQISVSSKAVKAAKIRVQNSVITAYKADAIELAKQVKADTPDWAKLLGAARGLNMNLDELDDLVN